VLREGCFGYFELGGECVGGPVRLLSGLAPQPMLLVYHFFSVALYSIYTLFSKPRVHKGESEARVPGFLDWPALMWRSVAVFWTACVVLLPVVFTELRSNVPSFNRAASMMAPGEVGKKESRFNNVVLLVGLAAAAAYYVNGGAQKHRLSDLLVFPTAKAQSLSS
jgi:squalene monooxygenase